MKTSFKLELIENKRACSICETKSRYDVVLNGEKVEQLYYNMTGYVGTLPLPEGGKLYIGEKSIASYHREIIKLNREAQNNGHSF